MFGRKKRKLDPKVRFQHAQFTKKLDKARQFKRVARAVPENRFDRTLTRVGLGSRLWQITVGLIILAALYLVYVPNFLSVRTITITGLEESDRAVAESAVRQSIATAAFYNPQHNLLFLSRNRIIKAVTSVPQVLRVAETKKDLATKTVKISVEPKRERFLVADWQKVYDVYNDGILKGEAGLKREEWQGEVNPGMVKLRVDGNLNVRSGDVVLTPELTGLLDDVASAVDNLPGATFGYVLLTNSLPTNASSGADIPATNTPLSVDELRVVLFKGGDQLRPFTVILDAHSDIIAAARRLSALLGQTAPDRYKNISYIDMRLEDRGFICLNNAPCDK